MGVSLVISQAGKRQLVLSNTKRVSSQPTTYAGKSPRLKGKVQRHLCMFLK